MITKALKKMIPSSIREKYSVLKYKKLLRQFAPIEYDLSNLKMQEKPLVDAVFKSQNLYNEWKETEGIIEAFNFPEMTGGVNSGDQRAIYYMIRHFQPKAMLEIGTHIGCSTFVASLALRKGEGNLTTVDIVDVNDPHEKNWLKFNSQYAPIEMVEKVEMAHRVKFITANSIQFLEKSNKRFDFIFLDGTHEADVIFQEITLALRVLAKNGVILIHDYFPKMKYLWNDKKCIFGPYLAVEEHKLRNKKLKIIPLGSLPWMTKLNSKVTSLALLTREDLGY